MGGGGGGGGKWDLLSAPAMILKKIIDGFLCIHIVLKYREGTIVKFKGQVKTE